MIDVIVPVYRGLDETRASLESVWRSRNAAPYRLIVINDCSPEPELAAWLRQAAITHPMLLLENEENLGFVATVNRGMALSQDNDVLLLNSDTEVPHAYLDRIHSAAYAANNIGTVTPFSNNATICSYPEFCQDNALPSGISLDDLSACFAKANPGLTIDIPTGVGFCMYIRRRLLDEIGLFDVESFGMGYGEENDFCCRASKASYRNVLAADVFVWHKGNVSFGDSHNERKQKCLETLQELHPDYLPAVFRHIQADPAREARLRVDFLRWQRSGLPRILFVSHDRGGGTEQNCRELADLWAGRALIFMLQAEPGGMTALTAYSQGEAAKLYFALPNEYSMLLDIAQRIGISRVHLHHTIGVDNSVWDLAHDLGVPQDYTTHDYYAMCPQISLTDEKNRYCGELGKAQCHDCLRKRPPVPKQSIVEWRDRYQRLLSSCDRIIFPSESVAACYARYFSLPQQIVAPHPDSLPGWAPVVAPFSVPAGRDIRVAVIGALSPMKGADVLEEAAANALSRQLPLRFKLFGYAYRALSENAKFEVHGKYALKDLASLLEAWQPDVVWLPALWPETYSYTLSECFQLGLPVVVTNLGAPADRIRDRPNSWALPWDLSAAAWNDSLLELARQSDQQARPYPHQESSFDFYGEAYLRTDSVLLTNETLLPDSELLVATRLRPLTQQQRSRLKMLEILVSLREHHGLSWLTKRIPMSVQRRIKNRLLNH